jgi:hypothetical protein
MSEAKGVSIREFARIVGVSDMAVRKAIASGKIVEAIDYTNPQRPKIDAVKAAQEWGKNYDPSYERSDKVSESINVGTTHKAPRRSDVDTGIPNLPHPSEGGRSLADIKRQTAEVKLRLAAVELKQKQGQLVDKDLVFRSLFAAGQEMRTALQTVPDRCIDGILAAKDRNDAHVILYNEITTALERLSEIYRRGLNDGKDED